MKGGHARSGPAPDPNALRRDRDAAGWTTLPAAGRPGEPPEWPLEDQTGREQVLWAREWRRPQALMWERNGQEHEVAVYVRRLVEVEKRDAAVTLGVLVRQMQESLGLSLPGLARLRWRIEAPAGTAADGAQPAGGQRAGRKAAAPRRQSARDRLKVVPDAGGS